MHCGLSVKTITRLKPRGARRSWAHLFCICFCVCVRQKPEDPQFEPHGWRRHYTGRYRESGISPLYLWVKDIFFSIGHVPHRMRKGPQFWCFLMKKGTFLKLDMLAFWVVEKAKVNRHIIFNCVPSSVKGSLRHIRSVIWVYLLWPRLWSATWVSFFHSRSVTWVTFQP